MSTLILLAAKPSRLRLEKLLYESRTFQTELPSQQLLLDEQVRPLIFQKRKIDEKLKKFSTLKTLAEADQQWLNLIKALSGEQRQVEENQYEAEADNENGTIWLVEKGKEEIENLELMREDVKMALERLTRSVSMYNSIGNSVVPEAVPEYSMSAGQVKLPRLGHKPFDGDIEHWNEFCSGFQNAADQQSIPKVQKLNYLLSFLKGKADQAVQGYLVTSENYDIVKEILYRRLGDRTVLLRTLYAGLKNIKKDGDMRGTVEEIERILRRLEAQGESVEHPHTEMTIEEKLPRWVIEKAYEAKENDPAWSAYKLRRLLEQITRRKEDKNRTYGSTDKKEPYKSSQSQRTELRPSLRSLLNEQLNLH